MRVSDADRIEQVKRLRQHSLNQLALRFLPPAWNSEDSLPVVSLMSWALEEHPADLETLRGWPYAENVEQQVLELSLASPQWTMDFILGREEEAGEVVENGGLLELMQAAASPLEAATILLNTVAQEMRYRKP